MARRAKRRRSGGPSYEEVKAQIEAREEEKRLKREERQSADEFQFEGQVGDNRIEPWSCSDSTPDESESGHSSEAPPPSP